tara:strand:+ start:582 stop:689 length:108 start_codon:yes stop_codon:yes gene_type:complete
MGNDDWVIVEPVQEEFIIIIATPFTETTWGKVINK